LELLLSVHFSPWTPSESSIRCPKLHKDVQKLLWSGGSVWQMIGLSERATIVLSRGGPPISHPFVIALRRGMPLTTGMPMPITDSLRDASIIVMPRYVMNRTSEGLAVVGTLVA
jgi:hypothetical protein